MCPSQMRAAGILLDVRICPTGSRIAEVAHSAPAGQIDDPPAFVEDRTDKPQTLALVDSPSLAHGNARSILSALLLASAFVSRAVCIVAIMA